MSPTLGIQNLTKLLFEFSDEEGVGKTHVVLPVTHHRLSQKRCKIRSPYWSLIMRW